MTGTDAACLHTNQSRSYLNHPVYKIQRLEVKVMLAKCCHKFAKCGMLPKWLQ